MTHEAPIAKVPIPEEQVHWMRGELEAEEPRGRTRSSSPKRVGRTDQTFDLMLLGFGRAHRLDLSRQSGAARAHAPRGGPVGRASARIPHHADAAGARRLPGHRDAR